MFVLASFLAVTLAACFFLPFPVLLRIIPSLNSCFFSFIPFPTFAVLSCSLLISFSHFVSFSSHFHSRYLAFSHVLSLSCHAVYLPTPSLTHIIIPPSHLHLHTSAHVLTHSHFHSYSFVHLHLCMIEHRCHAPRGGFARCSSLTSTPHTPRSLRPPAMFCDYYALLHRVPRESNAISLILRRGKNNEVESEVLCRVLIDLWLTVLTCCLEE